MDCIAISETVKTELERQLRSMVRNILNARQNIGETKERLAGLEDYRDRTTIEALELVEFMQEHNLSIDTEMLNVINNPNDLGVDYNGRYRV
jgi:hypothetical protein